MRAWRTTSALALALLTVGGCPRGGAGGGSAGSGSGSGSGSSVASGSARGSSRAAPAKPWPQFPRTAAAAKALVERMTRRRLPAHPRATLAQRVLPLLAKPSQLVSGRRAIADALRETLGGPRRGAKVSRRAVLLLGTFHDAPGQLAAFNWLVGAGGVGGFDAALSEHFNAGGRWRGVGAALQRGELALMRRAAAGDPAPLWRSQQRHDYTAWKYRYLDRVIGLTSIAGSAGTRALPCDMPAPLQKLAPQGKIDGAQVVDRLRELHCLLALRRRAPEARRVAMVWGQAHLAWRALVRFLPARDLVVAIDAFGHRHSRHTPEEALGKKLALLGGPLLVIEPTPCKPPRCPLRAALLLPGRDLRGRLERARDPLEKPSVPEDRSRLVLTSSVAGRFAIGQRVERLRPKKTIAIDIALPRGGDDLPMTWVFSPASKRLPRLVGGVRVLRGARIELRLRAEEREAELLLRPAPK